MRQRLLALTMLLALLVGLPVPSPANEMSNATWSETDASNNSNSPNGWNPGVMLPNQVEPTAQAMMGALKRWWDRINGTITTTGTAPHYIYTPVNGSFPTAYVQGETFVWRANFASGGADDLNVASLGAKPLYKPGASGMAAIAAGDLQSGQMVATVYDSNLNGGGGGFAITSGLISSGGGGGGTFTGGTLSSTTNMNGVAFNEAACSLASMSTVGIGGANCNYVTITGTNTITSFDTVQAGTQRILKFAGALTLTYNATTLILPGSASIPTAANDVAICESEGSGNWRCPIYAKADGTVLSISKNLDNLGTSTGAVLCRSASGWQIIANGSAGQLFQAQSAACPAWTTVNSSGQLNKQVFTASGTFTTPVGTNTSTVYKFTVTGSGAGGGTTPGGGGGAADTEIFFGSGLASGSTVTVTINNAGGTGANGGNSSIVFNGTTVTATGGNGGSALGAGCNTTPQAGGGGSGGAAGTNGNMHLPGGAGTAAWCDGGGNSFGGNGGASFWGGAAFGAGGNTGSAGVKGAVLAEWIQ